MYISCVLTWRKVTINNKDVDGILIKTYQHHHCLRILTIYNASLTFFHKPYQAGSVSKQLKIFA